MERAKSLGIRWSEYVIGCIKKDIAAGGDFSIPNTGIMYSGENKRFAKSLSIDPQVYQLATKRADGLGLRWSEYVVGCIRRDLATGGNFIIPELKFNK